MGRANKGFVHDTTHRPNHNSDQGAAWVFVHLDNGTYIQSQSKLVPSDASASGQFGTSLALSPDSNTAVIGAPADSSDFGGVWIFTRLENYTFIQQTMKLVPSDAIGTTFILFGNAVALSTDGYTALVGGYGDNSGAGAVWTFCRYTNDSWIQSGSKLVATPFVSAPQQGFALSYTSDASRFITGGKNEDNSIGAAWVFEESSPICPGPPTSAPTTLSPTTSTPTRAPNVFSPIEKLVGTGHSGQSSMGWTVAISKDGSTAMLGAPNDGSGAVWVFERFENGTWVQQGDKISGSGNFGWSVALSSNGNTAVIGAQGDKSFAGTASFFTRLPNKTWVQQGDKFQGSDRQGSARTGYTVAINSNGTVAFVSGPFDHTFTGAVWVVTNDGQGNWTQSGLKLAPRDSNGTAQMGKAIAVSDDAETLLVGGSSNEILKGAVWVFVRLANGTYVQSQPRLTPSDGAFYGYFGNAVALSSDGATALIGGPSQFGNFGGIWVFTRSSNGTFVQQTMKFVPSDVIGTFPFVGGSVALSADGYTALVGAYGDSSNIGAVWVFCRYDNGSWIQNGNKLIALDYVVSPQQGYSLAYSSETLTFISGGQNDNNGIGAAWVFDASSAACPGAPTSSPTSTSPTTTPTPTSSSTVSKGHKLIAGFLLSVLMGVALF